MVALPGFPFAGSQLASSQIVTEKDFKDTVVAASTVNVDISLLGDGDAIDGVTLTQGQTVLLKDQTDQSENGIYTVGPNGGPSTRALDADQDGELTNGTRVFVAPGGTANGNLAFVITSADPIDIGVDAIVFAVIPVGPHTHPSTEITDFDSAVDAREKRFVATVGAGLDYTTLEAAIDAANASNAHEVVLILDGITFAANRTMSQQVVRFVSKDGNSLTNDIEAILDLNAVGLVEFHGSMLIRAGNGGAGRIRVSRLVRSYRTRFRAENGSPVFDDNTGAAKFDFHGAEFETAAATDKIIENNLQGGTMEIGLMGCADTLSPASGHLYESTVDGQLLRVLMSHGTELTSLKITGTGIGDTIDLFRSFDSHHDLAGDTSATKTLVVNKVAHGSYTGNGAGSGTPLQVDVGFRPVYVWIAQRATPGDTSSVHVGTKEMTEDNGVSFDVTNDKSINNAIMGLNQTGFAVADQNADFHPNTNGVTYDFVAIGE